MPANNIPDDVRRFILTCIPSVPYLESVLLLQREQALTWSSWQLAQRLYVPEARAVELLQTLEAAGIAAKSAGAEGTYCYLPSPQLAEMLERVARHYSADLFAVTDLIHSSPDKRAYQFADAFRWRKHP